ncbi:MAG: hypothetical protein JW834_00385 [Candidatus Diapherotrites archaeon]|nr:hypothetical protein [Candidatus Diapherotrites archaeon]
MKRLLLILLLCTAFAQEDGVSLSKAMAKAQVAYPNLAVSPVSDPAYVVVLADGSEYWVVEFENVWVPVSAGTGDVITSREVSTESYSIRLLQKRMSQQRKADGYPTSKRTALNIMLSDVKVKLNFLSNSQPQLPVAIAGDVNPLISAASDMESALDLSLSLMTSIEAKQSSLLSSSAPWSDCAAWRAEFASLLSALESVVSAGNAYDDASNAFLAKANAFVADTANDAVDRQAVSSFATGLSITGVPGDLPGISSLVAQWREQWLLTSISDVKLSEDAAMYYSIYVDAFSQQSVVEEQEAAASSVNALRATVPAIVSRLSVCEDELSAMDKRVYGEMNDYYDKAVQAYNTGAEHYRALEYDDALESYRNAIAYSGDAESRKAELEDVFCQSTRPQPKTPAEILTDFVSSPAGVLAGLLVVALAGVYWWNSRKKEGSYVEEEYRPDW